nr:helix-turn-helix transcriptional regulator [Trichocoleus sp. FACHB-90]
MGALQRSHFSLPDRGRSLLRFNYHKVHLHLASSMGLVRLKIREMAAEKGWTLKEVSERSGVIYNTVKSYARRSEIATIDFISLQKLARTFDVMIEDLVEIVEE